MSIFVLAITIGIGMFIIFMLGLMLRIAWELVKTFGRVVITRPGLIWFILLFTPLSPLAAVVLVMMVINRFGE